MGDNKKSRLYLDFCDQYNYPEEIKRHFKTILSQIDYYLNLSKIKAIVLLGSTARGEISYRFDKKGEIDIFSDYEFIIISNARFKKDQIQALKNQFQINKKNWGINNPLFHIEFGLTSTLKWSWSAQSLWAYETKANGIVIYGEKDILKYLPNINVRNLDLGNTNELILIRLWMQLFNIPIKIIEGRMNDYECLILKYFLARNILEVLTIILPNEGVLFPTYKERVNYYRNNYKKIKFFNNKEFVDIFEEVLEMKLNLKGTNSLKWYYRNMLYTYLQLVRYLIKDNSNYETFSEEEFDKITSEIVKKNYFMKDKFIKKFRRFILEIKMLKAYYLKNKINPIESLSWLIVDKRTWIVSFLFYMHGYLYNYLFEKNNYIKENYLRKARYYIIKFDISQKNEKFFETSKGIKQWESMRFKFINFMSQWLYGNSFFSREDIIKVIEWRSK